MYQNTSEGQAMSRYYFHLWLGDSCERDEVGLECKSVEDAYLQAFHGAQDAWVDEIRQRTDPRRHRYEVTDDAGRIVFELPFVEVISRPSKAPAALLPIVRSVQRNCELVSEVARQVTRASDNIQKSRLLLEQLDAISRGARS